MSVPPRICLPLLLSATLFCAGVSTTAAADDGGPYATISDAAKQRYRSNYENLPPEDEAPYPLEGQDAITSQIVRLNQRIFAVGNLVATVLVDESGKPHSVTFYSLPRSDVDVSEAKIRKTYAAVLMGVAYKPAICGGKPCVMEFIYKAEFSKKRG